MTYEVSNIPKRLDEELFHRAVFHAVEFLDIDDVDFEIVFDSIGKERCGYVDFEEADEYNDEQEVVVYIAKRLSVKEILRTIFHELVHVKQYIAGELTSEGEIMRWNGTVYIGAYELLPWEVEAFALEEEMMNSFTERMKNGHS